MEPAITPELVAKHNLTPDEFAHAREILGRDDGKWVFESIFAALKNKNRHCGSLMPKNSSR